MIAGNANTDVSNHDVNLMLLNLITGYADTDADLCVKFLSLRYNKY